jgi:hypothetical protein
MNRVKNSLLLVFILALGFQLKAQETEISPLLQSFTGTFGVGMAESSPTFVWSLSYEQTHGLLKSKKLRLGYGLRFGAFMRSNDLTYITAPYRLTKDELIDTLVIANPQNFSLNAAFHLEYIFVPKFKAGFNIDVVGLSFGGQRDANYVYSGNDGGFPGQTTARPTTLSALLVGDNDWGQLFSEFYVAYAPTEKLWIKAGANMTFSEYTTAVELNNNNNRFRHKGQFLFLGISYLPFQ